MGQSASTPSAASGSAMPSMPKDHSSASAGSGTPPPGCPMHASNESSPYAAPPAELKPSPTAKGPATCPIQHDGGNPYATAVASSSSSPASNSVLNPLNQMPDLSHERAPGQVLDLPTDRTSSSIPRPRGASSPTSTPEFGSEKLDGSYESTKDEKVWEYPSPQQFYNALVRKGWETPEDSVEMMVDIHNFLNEEAWGEVLKWESRYPGGRNSILARFQGNPGKLSPKARFHLLAGKVFPSKFNSEPPFDRHDWVVHRKSPTDPTGPPNETRYVIDYYSAPPDDEGNPVFFLDVRPALDSVGSISDRIWKMAGGAFAQ